MTAACTGGGGRGTLWGPLGQTEVRTALYRIGVRDQRPELSLLVSNGAFDCAMPSPGPGEDAPEMALAEEARYAAGCRESAQHVALRLYDLHAARAGAWTGTFAGRSGADGRDLALDAPRLATASYYGVEEAVLISLDGLGRGYLAVQDVLLSGFGDGGEVWLEPLEPLGGTAGAPGDLRGWFSFPSEQIEGRFVARPCGPDASQLEALVADPVQLCRGP
jgi:hypothetical protein